MWVDTESSQIILATRIRLWNIPPKQLISPYGDFNRTIDLESQDLDVLRESVRIQKPRLVVIDSLRSAHKSDENSSRVGGVLEPLTSLARDTGAAFLVIHHLRKIFPGMEVDIGVHQRVQQPNRTMPPIPDRQYPEPNSRWQKLVIVKSNVGLIPPAIGFRVANKGLEFGHYRTPEEKNREGKRRGLSPRDTVAWKMFDEGSLGCGHEAGDQRGGHQEGEEVNGRHSQQGRKGVGVVATRKSRKEGGQEGPPKNMTLLTLLTLLIWESEP